MAVAVSSGILTESIRRYFELGCEVKRTRAGHPKRIKDQVSASKNNLLS